MRAVLPRSRPGRRAAVTVAVAVLAAGAALAVLHPGSHRGGGGGGSLLAATSSSGYCTGTALARFPAVNGVTNIAGTEGGHLWWRGQAGGTCIGTIVIDVRSGILAGTETLRIIVYDTRHPGGTVIVTDAFPAPEPGTYVFSFAVHRIFAGLTAVCAGAISCVTFSGPA